MNASTLCCRSLLPISNNPFHNPLSAALVATLCPPGQVSSTRREGSGFSRPTTKDSSSVWQLDLDRRYLPGKGGILSSLDTNQIPSRQIVDGVLHLLSIFMSGPAVSIVQSDSLVPEYGRGSHLHTIDRTSELVINKDSSVRAIQE